MTAPAVPAPAPPDAEVRSPATLAEARDAVVAGGALLISGGGTKLDWGPRPERVDAVIATTRLNRLLVHNAGDATAQVEAGITLVDLQTRLAEAGQWLAVDPVGGVDATVGGIFAADDAGPRRLAYGTLRDLVIGVTVVLSDGAVARSGGFVIKNVAGYDLTRLLCGSYGTLGLVARLNLRLHPLEEDSATVRVRCSPVDVPARAAVLTRAAVEPVALDWADGHLCVRLAGRSAALDLRLERLRRLLGTDAELVRDDAALWARLTAELAGDGAAVVLRIGSLSTHLPRVHELVAACARAAAVDAVTTSHVAVGAHTVRADGDEAALGAFVTRLREGLRQLRPVAGHAVVRRRPPGLDAYVDPWGRRSDPAGLGRRVKKRLDPERRFAPGRAVGGL